MKKFLNIAKKALIVIGITLLIVLIDAYAVMWICVNGPSTLTKDLFVLSVRETSAAGFLADIYCSKAEIAEIEKRNSVKISDGVTDTSIITIPQKSEDDEKPSIEDDVSSGDNNSEDIDEEVFEDGIRIEKISGSTYNGVVMIIKDPSRVFVGALDEYGEDVEGKTILQHIDKYDAIGGTNAGGFYDVDAKGKGGLPDGIVISNGELKYGEMDTKCQLIGLTNNNILVVGWMSAEKALNMGVRDAVSFGP